MRRGPRTTEEFTKTYLNYLVEVGKLKKRANLYHWFIIGLIFSYLKKIVASVVSLHYENTMFIFLLHLEGKLTVKTALKFQQF